MAVSHYSLPEAATAIGCTPDYLRAAVKSRPEVASLFQSVGSGAFRFIAINRVEELRRLLQPRRIAASAATQPQE